MRRAAMNGGGLSHLVLRRQGDLLLELVTGDLAGIAADLTIVALGLGERPRPADAFHSMLDRLCFQGLFGGRAGETLLFPALSRGTVLMLGLGAREPELVPAFRSAVRCGIEQARCLDATRIVASFAAVKLQAYEVAPLARAFISEITKIAAGPTRWSLHTAPGDLAATAAGFRLAHASSRLDRCSWPQDKG